MPTNTFQHYRVYPSRQSLFESSSSIPSADGYDYANRRRLRWREKTENSRQTRGDEERGVAFFLGVSLGLHGQSRTYCCDIIRILSFSLEITRATVHSNPAVRYGDEYDLIGDAATGREWIGVDGTGWARPTGQQDEERQMIEECSGLLVTRMCSAEPPFNTSPYFRA